MKRLLMALFILTSLQLSAQQGSSPDQTNVMMKLRSLKNALIEKDSVTLMHLLANDVTYGHTNGMVQTKMQLIRDVMSGAQDYKSIEPADMNIRVFDHTAIVNMKSAVKMIFNNSPLELNMYIMLVWIQKEGDWKLEARQSVKIN